MTIQEFRDVIKNNDFKSVYLLYGEEDYLIRKYSSLLKKSALQNDHFDLNYHEFENLVTIAEVDDILEQYPQASERKLVFIKNSGLLSQDDKVKRKFLKDIPPYVIVVFIERENKKFSKPLLKIIEELGDVVEFKFQQASDLRRWALREVNKAGKRINNSALERIIQASEGSLTVLSLNVDKIISAAGDVEEISNRIIEEHIQQSLEFKVFGFIDALLVKKRTIAYQMLDELKIRREEPVSILAIIFIQLSSMVMVWNLNRDNQRNIAEFFPANKKFLADKISRDIGKYNIRALREILDVCAEFDLAIKKGTIEPWLAIEVTMAKILNQ